MFFVIITKKNYKNGCFFVKFIYIKNQWLKVQKITIYLKVRFF